MTLFLLHNWPLVVFGGLSIFYLVISIASGSRKYVLLFVGFLLLTFEFEFSKHLFSKVKTDMLDLIFPPSERFTKYNLIMTFLNKLLPLFLKLVGWMLVLIGFRLRSSTPRETT